MKEEFHDFDAAWAELEEVKPLSFKAFGRMWEIPSPSDGSARSMTKLIRMSEELDDSEESKLKQLAVLKDYIPEEVMNDLLDAGLSVRQYGTLIKWIVSQMKDEKDEGEEVEEANPQKASEKTGA